MRMYVDWEVGILFSDSGDEAGGCEVNRQFRVLFLGDSHSRSLRFEQTRHVLDTKDVDAFGNKLVDEVKIVLQGILRLLRVGDIATVAHSSFHDTTSLLGSVNAEFHL